MTFKNILFRTFLATALFWAVACEKPEPENGGTNPDNSDVEIPGTSEINGTAILEGNNLVGLISDSSTGKGIAGVAVSDGYSVVKTDNNGVYQFAGSRYAKTVFISLPADYQVPLDANKKPAFYKVGITRNQVNRNDFKLTPLTASEENFTFIAIGDPQCSNDKEVSRYQNETINDITQTLSSNQIAGKYKNAYAMTLGDIVNDTPEMWEKLVASMENVQIGNNQYLPIFQCIGNHRFPGADGDALALELTGHARQAEELQCLFEADCLHCLSGLHLCKTRFLLVACRTNLHDGAKAAYFYRYGFALQ